MFDFEEYERECNKIRETNNSLLSVFEKDLISAGLSPKTIKNHIENTDLYINEFLLRERPLPMEHGTNALDSFMLEFYICKCLWSTPATVKSTAASIKKFYKCMFEHGKIGKEEFECLCDDIKDGMEYWQDACEAFNEPNDESDSFRF